MSPRWSQSISDRYQIELPPGCAAWFDHEMWRVAGGREFRRGIHPEELLHAAPSVLWPGLMGCDLLPILGNRAGDWVCLRIGPGSAVGEFVHWFHGGGDWTPWGRDLPEAIVFDAVWERLPGPLRTHAVPAVDVRADAPDPSDPWLAWALDHVDDRIAAAVRRGDGPESMARVLLDADVASVAVLAELAMAYPEHAGDHALAASRLAPHAAWTWDVAGRAAENEGDLASAIRHYHRGATCSVFGSQSTRFGTHASESRAVKYSVARLQTLVPDQVSDSPYLRLLSAENSSAVRESVSRHWLQRATDEPDPDQAIEHLYAALWDVGPASMESCETVIARIAKATAQRNQKGRAAVAETHLRRLRTAG